MKTLMKISKRMILMIFAFMFTIAFVRAQPGGQQGPPPIPNDNQVKKMVTKLSEDLALNDSQEQQVSALYYAHFKEVRELSAKKASREGMEILKRNFEKNVKSLLTSDQQKKFVAFQKKNQPQSRKPRH